MKRSLGIFAFAAAAVAMLGACQKEQTNSNINPNLESTGIFTVNADYTEPVTGTSTKTALVDDDSPYVKWLSTDKINMWEFVDGTENACFQTAQDGTHLGDNDKSATFDISLNGTDPVGSTYCYTAIYPEGAVTENGGIYSFEIPATQTLVNRNFAANADILIGKPVTQASRISSGTNISVQFKRPGTAVGLTLKGITAGEKITSIKITAPEGQKIAGRNKIDLTTGEVSDKAYENATNEITLNCGNIAASGNDVFYFRCLDGTWASGSSVSIKVETGVAIYTKTVNLPKDYVFADGGLTKFGFQGMTRTNKTIDLSVNGTANCYIVGDAGTYQFKAVKGNSDTPVGAISSVEVVWETVGTATAPAKNSLISAVSLPNQSMIRFTSTGIPGNALIAAKDASGNILWSWHIWIPESKVKSARITGITTGYLMDRNLGALNTTPGDIRGAGLLYQWGRKEPFMGFSQYSLTNPRAAATANFTVEASTAETGTLDYAVAHPLVFIKKSSTSSYADWVFTEDNRTSWAKTKTIYDPCPPGYSVPSNSLFNKATMTCDKTNFGFTSNGDNPMWFPFSGTIWPSDGSAHSITAAGYNWCVEAGNSGAVYVYDVSKGFSTNINSRACGNAVRCYTTTEP